ncbi:hypothetical protein BDA99DRAFT_323567 [Phascolomyces articulosus]|uniref:Uncharacterized protein n=1 Tax=Phascolomyces articulosus TaxID=60185 RepID=A0AAD5PGA7_9FUNG|nr:hypothetical protein BDA99DRAFT_323567 [Phascolomyces articulosus]
MNANRDFQSVATAERTYSTSPFSDTNTMRRPPGSRRERLRSFARATSQVIRQEINKYYYPPESMENAVTNTTMTSGMLNNRIIQPSTTTSLTRPVPPPRQRTQSMNDLAMSNNTQDTVQPHCMLFPTYAYKVLENDNQQQFKWKIRLAGWTFAKPGSSRIERWILAAGRTYGGLSANSAEDIHFARLLNQFRAQTIRGVDVQLYIDGVIPPDHALTPALPPRPNTTTSTTNTPTSTTTTTTTTTTNNNNTTRSISPSNNTDSDNNNNNNHHPFGIHHLYDLAHDAIKTIMINSGPTGRFEDLLMLDPTQALQHVGRKMLRLKASFENGIDTPHDGFVDLIEPEGISVISVCY